MHTDATVEVPALLTPSEAAIALRVSVHTVYRLCKVGDLPSIRLGGPGSSVRIPVAAIDELLARRR
jgi:excisionase family DNA binding protein